MNITTFYDSSEPQSVMAAAIVNIIAYGSGSTLIMKNTKGLNEGSITAQIASIGAATQNRVFVLVGVAAGHATGNLTTAQVTALAAKLDTTDPQSDSSIKQLGAASGNKQPAYRVWEEIFPVTEIPKIVQYTSTETWPRATATADSVAAGTLTDSGAFTIDEEIDNYVCIKSATLGAGQIRKITDNTADVLTLESNWDVTPTGTIVYEIIPGAKVAEALYSTYPTYFLTTRRYNVLTDNEVIERWKKLLHNGKQSLLDFAQRAPEQDLEFLAEEMARGKAALDYTDQS
jgi:hypothetical protein